MDFSYRNPIIGAGGRFGGWSWKNLINRSIINAWQQNSIHTGPRSTNICPIWKYNTISTECKIIITLSNRIITSITLYYIICLPSARFAAACFLALEVKNLYGAQLKQYNDIIPWCPADTTLDVKVTIWWRILTPHLFNLNVSLVKHYYQS